MYEGACCLPTGAAPLWLLPERAAYIASADDAGDSVLLVADLHLGKAEAFHRRGIAVPPGGIDQDLSRLVSACRRTQAAELVILGDLMHAGAASRADVEHALGAVRASLPRRVTLIRGNHDRGDLSWLDAAGIHVSSVPVERAGMVLAHECEGLCDHEGRRTRDGSVHAVCGHVHPVVVLGDRGDRVRLPCFHLDSGVLTLPAFGSFTGGSCAGRRGSVYAIGVDEVFQV